jgi:class 3 adenylate cyclase
MAENTNMAQIKFAKKVIMFCDAHSFSKIMAFLGDDCAAFIQEYYDRLGGAVVSAGGQVVKYIGDAILSVFDAGAETQAVECARQMRAVYSVLLRRFELTAFRSELEVGIGAGRVCCGTFGHPSLRMADVFGEAVNETAVVMHYRGIALTEAAHDGVSKDIKTRELPAKKLKWRDRPLRVWSVEATHEAT